MIPSEKRTKVAQIFYTGLGGQGSVAFSLIEANQDNHKLDFSIIFYGIENLLSEYDERCALHGIKYNCVKKIEGLDLVSLVKYYKALKSQNPEYIILHSTNLILATKLYSFFNSCKIIAVEHTSNDTKTKLEFLWSFLCMFFADRIVLLSDEYATILSKILSIFYRKNKVSIISNGINVKKFFLKSKSADLTRDNEIKIGMMSRLSFTKDQPTLIKAFKLLLDRKMGQFKLFIAGDGDKEKGLKDFTKELRLTKEVKFLGLLNETECVSFLHSLDIYIHSSISETVSTAIMQAMACGLPIIATNVDGITNMIIDGKTGLIFELGNENDLLEKINILINDKELRETLSQNAYKCAHDKYSNVAMYEKYCELMV